MPDIQEFEQLARSGNYQQLFKNPKPTSMRILIFIALSLLVFYIQAQDTLYFDKKGKITDRPDKAHRFEVRTADPDNPDRVSVKRFNIIGLPISYIEYKSEKDRIIHGLYKEWYDNGQLKREKNYYEGEYHGELLTYWPDGALRRRDLYDHGSLVSGKIWDRDGEEMEYFDFRTEPVFPGGLENLAVILSHNLRYPTSARRRSIEGIVVIGFVVERDGQISEPFVHTSVHRSLDREALRVVKQLPYFIPGKIEGEPVRFRFFLPVRFVLD